MWIILLLFEIRRFFLIFKLYFILGKIEWIEGIFLIYSILNLAQKQNWCKITDQKKALYWFATYMMEPAEMEMESAIKSA